MISDVDAAGIKRPMLDPIRMSMPQSKKNCSILGP
jgi:hypothetical protein